MDNQKNKKLTRKEKKALKKQNKKKLSSADKKGIVLDIFLSIVAVCLLINSVSVLNREAEKKVLNIIYTASFVAANDNYAVEENTAVTPPSVPQQSEPATENTTVQDDSQKQEATQPQDKEPQQETQTQLGDKTDEKQEILDVVTDGINSLKSENANFIGKKTQTIDMELTECSAPAFAGIVNRIIDFFTKTENYEFDFTNGKGEDPENGGETTSMATFPPEEKNFSLTIEGVAEATKEVQGENTVYKVKLVPEKSTKENSATKHHAVACDTLDLTSFSLPFGEITKADLEYPGATVGVTLDKDGNVVEYFERTDIIGIGEASAMGITGGGTVEGYIDEAWIIQWK